MPRRRWTEQESSLRVLTRHRIALLHTECRSRRVDVGHLRKHLVHVIVAHRHDGLGHRFGNVERSDDVLLRRVGPFELGDLFFDSKRESEIRVSDLCFSDSLLPTHRKTPHAIETPQSSRPLLGDPELVVGGFPRRQNPANNLERRFAPHAGILLSKLRGCLGGLETLGHPRRRKLALTSYLDRRPHTTDALGPVDELHPQLPVLQQTRPFRTPDRLHDDGIDVGEFGSLRVVVQMIGVSREHSRVLEQVPALARVEIVAFVLTKKNAVRAVMLVERFLAFGRDAYCVRIQRSK